MPYILLIEDNPGDVRLLIEILTDLYGVGGFELKHVERVADAVEYLRQGNRIEIILSDITLPDSQGMQTFDSLRSIASELPVVFMTGSNDERYAVDAIQQGAQDYLIKGRITAEGLSKTIIYAIERKKAQIEMNRVRAEAQDSEQQVKLLAQQKRQLINLNKAKDEFISLASHQLRTPATAVKQYIGMIIEGYVGDVDAAQLPMLQTAYDSNERQLTIINELLKTAQLDSNRYELHLRDLAVDELVQEVINAHKPILKLRHQKVRYTPDDGHHIKVDPTEFKLVLTNLLENASKYTPDGKTISVNVEKAGRKLHISVTDEGVGIARENQRRIFDKFTRIDNEMSDTVTGSGLGLYWVRKIMRLHGGSIDVASELGKGSTFTLCLPL